MKKLKTTTSNTPAWNHTQSYKELLAKALNKGKNITSARKLKKIGSYSSFWMDSDHQSRFGLGEGFSASGDLIKSMKLSAYRKAITNFTKILTQQEIPVEFRGAESYTDGKSIVLSTDIKDNNFDVTVGLALHEASHIKLTDFQVLHKLRENLTYHPHNHTVNAEYDWLSTRCEDFKTKHSANIGSSETEFYDLVKNLLNYVEDRRIDSFVFRTSPGYKAYYHKLYENYWNSHDTVMYTGLTSNTYTNPKSVDSWLFQIINLMHPAFNAKAMPGLSAVVDILDLPNIKRLQSTKDALITVFDMLEVMMSYIEMTKPLGNQGESPQGEGSGEQGEGGEGDSEQGEGGTDGDSTALEDLNPTQLYEIDQALRKMKKFLNGEMDAYKKAASNSLRKNLKKIDKQEITVEKVEGNQNVFNMDATKKHNLFAISLQAQITSLSQEIYKCDKYADPSKYRELKEKCDGLTKLLDYDILPEMYRGGRVTGRMNTISDGLNMGALLGRKLMMRNEARERIDNRLTTGKIDNRRLSAAGYGIENIFQQISIDKYKKANIHISIDASGSMGGTKWENTLMMVAAIAKAVKTTSNVRLQVSARYTFGNSQPSNLQIYDSTKCTLKDLENALTIANPHGLTPEGLCFEALIKTNKLVAGTSELDSYFINISDGEPCGVGNYQGPRAWEHTLKQVRTMQKKLNISVLSYFVTERMDQGRPMMCGSAQAFKEMYKETAQIISPNNVLEIAKTLNTAFLSDKSKMKG